MPQAASIAFATVILAAGASTRMQQPKLLLPWGNTTVIEHLIHQWQLLGADQTAVVRRADDQALETALVRAGLSRAYHIINPDPARGMFSSVQAAARWDGWKNTITHWVLVLGDQPHISGRTLEKVLHFARQHPHKICQPSRAERPRHPVILPSTYFFALAQTAAPTLKHFLAQVGSSIALLEMDEPGLDLDMDCRSDYEAAWRLFSEHQRGLIS